MSSSMSGVELLSIIRSTLDPSGYVAGAQKVQQANAQIQQSGEKVVAGQEKITRGMDQAARGLATWVQRADPAAKAAVDLANAQALLDRNLRLGLITADDHARGLAIAERQYLKTAGAANQTANAFGVTARQAQQLAPQINDVVTSLLGGASAFQVLTQQGGQITQAMGGVGNTFRAIAGLFTPMRVGVLAVGGALLGTVAAYEGTERRLSTLRGQLRGFTSDYEAMARTLERSARSQSELMPGVASADVRTAQTRLAQVVRPEDRENLQAYTALAIDLSRTLDKDLSSALERVARVIQRPAEEARNLAEQGVRGFDERFRRHVELLELSGNRGQATAEVFARLNGVFGGAARDMPLLERALGNVEKAFEGLWNQITDGLSRAGAPFLEWLARSQTNARAGVEAGAWSLLGVPGAALGLGRGAGAGIASALGLGGSSATTTTPTVVSPAVAEAARITGVDPELLARVHRAEGVQNPDGTWRTSSAGARGPMQVMPGTFAEMAQRYGIQGGIDDPQANMLAGAYYLRERLQQRGDVALALADYNAGPGRVNQVLSGQAGLPDETSRYVRRIRDGYSGTGLAAPAGATAPVAARGGIASDSAAAGVRELNAEQRAYQAALAEARGRGTQVSEVQDLEARRARFQSALAQAPSGSTEYRELQQAIEGINAALSGTERPIEQFLRGQREAARVMQAPEGAARELAQAMQSLEEAARAQGRDPTEAERAEVRRLVLERSTAQYRDLTANVERQIEAEERLARSYAQGTAAVQETEARNKALEEVRRAGIAGTEQEAAAVEALTQRYMRLNAAQNGRAIAAQLPDQQQQIDLIRQQNATIGMSQSDQAAALARINATAYVNRGAPGTSETAAGQAYISNAVDIANLQEQARTLKEIEGYGRDAAGVLVDGFSAVVFQGQSVRDTLKSVEQQLLQLGTRALILKPLEEALGRLATSLFGGGSGGGGGILGSLGSLFGSSGAAGFTAAGAAEVASVGLEGGLKTVMAAAPMVLHGGGLVGNDNAPQRIVPAALFRSAPRFHSGGGYLSRSEFPAILEYGERVLTTRQQQAVGAAVAAPRGQPITINQTIQTADPGSFNRSRGQIAAAARRDIARARRNA